MKKQKPIHYKNVAQYPVIDCKTTPHIAVIGARGIGNTQRIAAELHKMDNTGTVIIASSVLSCNNLQAQETQRLGEVLKMQDYEIHFIEKPKYKAWERPFKYHS